MEPKGLEKRCLEGYGYQTTSTMPLRDNRDYETLSWKIPSHVTCLLNSPVPHASLTQLRRNSHESPRSAVFGHVCLLLCCGCLATRPRENKDWPVRAMNVNVQTQPLPTESLRRTAASPSEPYVCATNTTAFNRYPNYPSNTHIATRAFHPVATLEWLPDLLRR